jgi:hypothetical protein
MTHEYTVTRKLQEQSGSYFVILPKLWVKARGLKERDEMAVTFNDKVTINPPVKEVTE